MRRFHYALDLDMWQRIAREYAIWHDPRPLAEYKVHSASADRGHQPESPLA